MELFQKYGKSKSRVYELDYHKYVFTTHIIYTLLIFVMILLSSNFVNAKVEITNIDFEPTITESSYINISFNAESNTSNVTYEIYKEGIILVQNNNYKEKTSYDYEGTYEYVLVAYDNESSDLENITIEVINVPLAVDILSPIDAEYLNNNISIIVSINQEIETACNYDVSDNSGILVEIDTNTSNLINNSLNSGAVQRIFTGSVVIGDGDHSLAVYCENEFDYASDDWSFKVFSNPVQITSMSYTLDQGNGLHINLETEYVAECRYSLQNREFSSMNMFSSTSNIMHSVSISGLTEGAHKIYLGCKSYNDVVSYDSLDVVISTRPTATISIDKTGPLKKGIYGVTLKTSKDVQNTPVLYYTFNDENTQRTISLAGSGNTWKGYMIIDDDVGNKVGAFKFSAVDFNGLTGNIITAGEIFLVDTVPPEEVIDLNAEFDEDEVLLSWYYESDDFETFRIYRADDETVNKNDLLKITDKKELTDKDIDAGGTYTYMVAAVDAAGNEGPQSDEITIEIPIDMFGASNDLSDDESNEGSNDAVSEPPKSLDPSLYKLVDEKISEIEIILLDIDSMQKRLDETTDATSLKVISILELDSKIKNSKSSIESILSQLRDLKKQDATQSDLEVKLNKLKLDAIKAQSNVLEELIIEEKGSFEQITQESDVDSAILYMIEGINVSKSQLKEYIGNNKRLQDRVIVKTESISFKIRNLNQENYDKKTLIYKTIRSSNKLGGVSIIEIIPKEVENTASEISYIKIAEPEILKDDPVIKWDYDSFESTELYYMVDNSVPLTSLKNIRTVILEKPDFTIGEDKITGMLSFESVVITKLSPIHWIIIVGVGMIFVLGTYFVVLENQDKNRIRKHNIIANARGNPRNNQMANQLANQSTNRSNNNNMTNNSTVSKLKKETKNVVSTKKDAYPDYAVQKNNLEDKLPEVIVRKIEYCNSVINMMDYERARSLYNDTVKAVPGIFDNNSDDVALKKLSHVRAKLDAYRHIHNARRHLYYKRLGHFSVTIKSLNECYGQIAHNIGFMQHIDNGSEVKFLNFIAENVKQLEKNRDMILKK